ncbi:MAG: AI-2E family transporter, partial [Pseudomonadota bacterium]
MPSRPEGREDRHPLQVPITGIFILMLIQALIFASEFLLPVSIAILGYFLLNVPRRGLQRLGLSAPLIATLFTVTIGVVIALAGMALADPIYNFVADLPTLLEQAMIQLTGPGGPLEAISRAADATEEVLAAAGEEQPVQVEVVSSGGGMAASVAALAPGLLSQIVFALCLLFFLTASGDLFIQKTVQAVDRFEDKRKT